MGKSRIRDKHPGSATLTGCSLLRAEGFSCSLGVLYGGLGISKLQFSIKKIEIKFPAKKFFKFSVIKPWIRIRIKSMRIRNSVINDHVFEVFKVTYVNRLRKCSLLQLFFSAIIFLAQCLDPMQNPNLSLYIAVLRIHFRIRILICLLPVQIRKI
jgi:hypothetical protein